nr:MAG TPA: hypothetical protein [Herelleviridae sp.]
MISRDPSIHVKVSDLAEILSQVNLKQKPNKLANEILKLAQPYQLRGRNFKLLQLKAKERKKTEKSLKATANTPNGVVEMFNNLLTSFRQKQTPNAKIKVIRADSKDYLMLKEVAMMAYEFVKHFEIDDVREGLLEYIQLGYRMMARYALNRYKYYDTRIYEVFSDKVEVLTDKHRDKTMEFYHAWQQAMLEYTNLEHLIYIEDDYSKFIHIVLGRKDADKHEADYTDWVVSQFEGLSFLNVVPELNQMYGENALKRYEKYLHQISYSKKLEEEEDGDLLNYYNE